MARLSLAKPYDEAADALECYVKNAMRTEGEEGTIRYIEIIGDYEFFDLHDMDMWGGHLRFRIYDTAPADEEERRARVEMLMYVPQLASVLTQNAAMEVAREVRRKVTQTVEENGRVITRNVVV